MAFLIPENVRSDRTVTRSRRRVAAALAVGLDDTATAWYEPPFDPEGTRPDFVVLDPELGVVVIVVFDGDMLGVLDGRLRVAEGAAEREIVSPLEQANTFGMRLRAAIAANPRLTMIPVGGVVAFPELDRARADELGLGSIIDIEQCLFKADFDRVIREGDEAVIHRRFLKALDGGLQESLSDAAEDELRALIHPEIVIRPATEQGSLFAAAAAGGDVVTVMDRRQERLAKGLGSGHRVIRGVAGSGKTLVLVHRARMLARALPSKRILVTCFTRSLASQLRAQLAQHDNVEVVHLHQLMARVIHDAGKELPSRGGRVDWDALPAAALDAIRATQRPRYRAVMVDEAQDFDTAALGFCVRLLEDAEPEDQDLVIVADSAQNIFRRQFRWKDAGIRAQGRTRVLRVNYRNTAEILAFAHAFLVADPSIEIDDVPNPDDELTIIPAESAARTGPPPSVTVTPDASAEIDAVVRQVRDWFVPRLPARSVAVLMAEGRSEDRARRIVDALRSHAVPVFWVTDPDEPANRDEAGATDDPVIVSTIHSAKGLEFPRVVVCGLGSTERTADRLLAARKLLYVGFTRAVDQLAVVTERTTPLVADIEAVARDLSGGSGDQPSPAST